MKRKLMFLFTAAVICSAIVSCGKAGEGFRAGETSAFRETEAPSETDASSGEEDEIVQGVILEDGAQDAGSADESAETLNEQGQEESTAAEENVNYALYSCTTDRVNLRREPSKNSESIRILEKDTALRVAGIDADSWAQVQTESGEEGYVWSDYILDPVSEDEWAAYQEQEAEQEAEQESGRQIICIDAGHQAQGNNGQEPVGPGASQTKAKVSSGTQGVSTGKMEYELTLEIALKLQKELEQRGYQVVMCRTSNDVDISNAERAAVANNAGADAFVRIHADGAESSSAQGAHTICQTPSNPYNGQLYQQSLSLSQCVISEYLAATGAKQAKADDGVDERDDLSGINWCSVPATLLEMGFMTNPAEDTLMSSPDYQEKMVTGIANGIDKYLGRLSE